MITLSNANPTKVLPGYRVYTIQYKTEGASRFICDNKEYLNQNTCTCEVYIMHKYLST